MPLSDEEARLLHQLEQSLAAEDPDFASTLRGSKLMAHNRRVALLAVLGFLAGIAILFGGAVSKQTWLGVFGFVAMLAAAYVFTIAWRRGIGGGPEDERRASSGGGARPGRQGKRSGSFVDRMEERWQRRREGDGL